MGIISQSIGGRKLGLPGRPARCWFQDQQPERNAQLRLWQQLEVSLEQALSYLKGETFSLDGKKGRR